MSRYSSPVDNQVHALVIDPWYELALSTIFGGRTGLQSPINHDGTGHSSATWQALPILYAPRVNFRQTGRMDSFDLRRLTDRDFEVVCRDLFQEILGLPLELFAPGRDQGIDLRHMAADGTSVVIQCKHWERSGRQTLLDRMRRDEFPKIKALHPTRYILATTVELTVGAKERLLKDLSPHVLTTGDLYGIEQIAEELRTRPALVRRHFRLWMSSTAVLQDLLHKQILIRSSDLLDELDECVRTFAPTPAFDRAQELLQNGAVCLIAGIPGIGKTTMAKLLARIWVGEGYQLVEVSHDVDELDKAWLDDVKQVFYYDDFLGQTALDHKFNKNEESRLIKAIRRVRKTSGKKLILTTREYILARAKQLYARLHEEDLDLFTCTVELDGFTESVRATILYNHLHHSAIPAVEKRRIADPEIWWRVIHHRNFNPRTVERTIHLTRPTGTMVDELIQNLDNPERIWSHIIDEQLDDAAVHLLEVLSTFGVGALLDMAQEAWNGYRTKLGEKHDSRLFRRALKTLDGSLIEIKLAVGYLDGQQLVDFHNPSIQDYMQQRMSRNQLALVELLDSIEFPEQARWMVSLADPADSGALAARLGDHTTALARAVMRTFEEAEPARNNDWAETSEEDDSWAKNLQRTLIVAEILRSAELADFVISRIEANPSAMSQAYGSHLASLAQVMHESRLVPAGRSKRLVADMLDVICAEIPSPVSNEEWSNLADFDRLLSNVPGPEAVNRRSELHKEMIKHGEQELDTYWGTEELCAASREAFDDWSWYQTEEMIDFLSTVAMPSGVRHAYEMAKSAVDERNEEQRAEQTPPIRTTKPSPPPRRPVTPRYWEHSSDEAELLRTLLAEENGPAAHDQRKTVETSNGELMRER